MRGEPWCKESGNCQRHTAGILFLVVAALVQVDSAALRLAGGSTAAEGTIEILRNKTWWVICDDGFSLAVARVACKELGYPDVVKVHNNSFYGRGNIATLPNKYICSGMETTLSGCPNETKQQCINDDVVGVECDTQTVGLQDGDNVHKGKLKVYYNGEWRPICGSNWTYWNEMVVCRHLGCNAVCRFPLTSDEIIWSEPTFSIHCRGYETLLAECSIRYVDHCRHYVSVGISCTTLRLVGGSTEAEGSIEILRNNQWWTICDDGWDDVDALVVCQELGYPGVLKSHRNSFYGRGNRTIWASDFKCNGSETTLNQCNFKNDTEDRCIMDGIAGVECDSKTVRLLDGEHSQNGNVILYYNGHWGRVCGVYWDPDEAVVVCRQLGYNSLVQSYSTQWPSINARRIRRQYDVKCNGSESSLLKCSVYRDLYGNHQEQASITCSALRLVGGSTAAEGTIEILRNKTWWVICDDGFSLAEARVACKELGYPSVVKFHNNSFYGRGNRTTLQTKFKCSGMETTLSGCSNEAKQRCNNDDVVGVECDTQTVRLRNGDNVHKGKLEVYYNGEWTPVCGSDWTYHNAMVVCRHLGYNDVSQFSLTSDDFIRSKHSISIHCLGFETLLAECSIRYVDHCRHYVPVGISCMSLRLTDGAANSEGIVEIWKNNQWWNICNTGWDSADGIVACKELGYPSGLKSLSHSYMVRGNRSIMSLNEFDCTGRERALADCPVKNRQDQFCDHGLVAAVICDNTPYIRLHNGIHFYEGNIELYYEGKWGYVCVNGLSWEHMTVVCRQLGYDTCLNLWQFPALLGGSKRVFSIDCNGSQLSLQNCSIKNSSHCDELRAIRCCKSTT
ncbi:scavenger receptor cysteine-rich domain superfamily protein-like [Corticium candelabrum]|uniref:scavenger receptor cysteine-rich domain superfamily protein-like n=1 Tax=Corticium candelabrum TaxID=121492 RepID=UPI002E26A699|nr:scavenger receptor cysteine-rich domain superfamily protein-like [Corticium candelabrum]